MRQKHRHDEAYERHEVDQITNLEYKEHVCGELSIELFLTDFIEGWNSILLSEVDGMRGAAVLVKDFASTVKGLQKFGPI